MESEAKVLASVIQCFIVSGRGAYGLWHWRPGFHPTGVTSGNFSTSFLLFKKGTVLMLSSQGYCQDEMRQCM